RLDTPGESRPSRNQGSGAPALDKRHLGGPIFAAKRSPNRTCRCRLRAVDGHATELGKRLVVYLTTMLLSLTVHEYAHAFVADRLGDDTPRRQGRLTLSPLAHYDIWGTF